MNVNLQKKGQGKEDTRDIPEPIESNIEIIPETISDEIINKNVEDDCPVCKNGDQPSDAHVCYICQKNVHAIDSCSVPVGKEGYGQKRMCKICQKTNNIQNIIV